MSVSFGAGLLASIARRFAARFRIAHLIQVELYLLYRGFHLNASIGILDLQQVQTLLGP